MALVKRVDRLIASYRMTIVVTGLVGVWVGTSLAVMLAERLLQRVQRIAATKDPACS